MLVDVDVGALDREPDVGLALVGVGDGEGVHRVRRFVQVRAGGVDVLGVLGVAPRARQRQGEHGTRVVVLLHLVAGWKPVAEHPQALVEVDVQQLDAELAGVDPRGLVLAEMQGLGEAVHRDHGLGCVAHAWGRGSLGRPRTISPRMLRWTWLVPA